MNLPWSKPKDNYVYTWESEPYVFQKGSVYVIEINRHDVQLNEVKALERFFIDQGIICQFVFSDSGNALNPIKVKRKKEQV